MVQDPIPISFLTFEEEKLRDVEEFYSENGHVFAFNKAMLCSYDICAACEAHAMLWSIEQGLAKTVEAAATLFELQPHQRQGNVNFLKCPVPK